MTASVVFFNNDLGYSSGLARVNLCFEGRHFLLHVSTGLLEEPFLFWNVSEKHVIQNNQFSGNSNCSRSLGARRAADSRATTNIMASRTGGRHFTYASGTNRLTGTIPSTIHAAMASRKDCPIPLRRALSIALIFSVRVPPFGSQPATAVRNSFVESWRKPTGGVSSIKTPIPLLTIAFPHGKRCDWSHATADCFISANV